MWQIYLPAPRRIPRPKFDVSSPNEVHRLMYGRDPCTKLPHPTGHVHPDDEEVRARDQSAKAIMKAYADGKNRARV